MGNGGRNEELRGWCHVLRVLFSRRRSSFFFVCVFFFSVILYCFFFYIVTYSSPRAQCSPVSSVSLFVYFLFIRKAFFPGRIFSPLRRKSRRTKATRRKVPDGKTLRKCRKISASIACRRRKCRRRPDIRGWETSASCTSGTRKATCTKVLRKEMMVREMSIRVEAASMTRQNVVRVLARLSPMKKGIE